MASGVLEASVSKKKALYQNNHTISEVKKFLKNKKFKIFKIMAIDENIKNEKNIYFYNNKVKFKKKAHTNYNLRHFRRIVDNNTNLKDKLINKIKIFTRLN